MYVGSGCLRSATLSFSGQFIHPSTYRTLRSTYVAPSAEKDYSIPCQAVFPSSSPLTANGGKINQCLIYTLPDLLRKFLRNFLFFIRYYYIAQQKSNSTKVWLRQSRVYALTKSHFYPYDYPQPFFFTLSRR